MGHKDIQEFVKDEEWQTLRKTFLGTWSKTPAENVAKLREFLGPLDKATYERLHIVLNYLTGTGFRTGRISHDEISKLRSEISAELKKRPAKRYKKVEG